MFILDLFKTAYYNTSTNVVTEQPCTIAHCPLHTSDDSPFSFKSHLPPPWQQYRLHNTGNSPEVTRSYQTVFAFLFILLCPLYICKDNILSITINNYLLFITITILRVTVNSSNNHIPLSCKVVSSFLI